MTQPNAINQEVTLMLHAVQRGEREAVNQLIELLYAELRGIAASHLRHERRSHTLQATALVHEAYVRLVQEPEQTWQNRAHFFASASSAIRRILIEHARKRSRLKRGGGQVHLGEDAILDLSTHPDDDILAIDEALEDLARFDAQKARLVELRFFGGLTIEETATVLGVSESTVTRDWRLARAWLRVQLDDH